jgi:hypothetical protein
VQVQVVVRVGWPRNVPAGWLASSFHGEPRAPSNTDLGIDRDRVSLDRFVQPLDALGTAASPRVAARASACGVWATASTWTIYYGGPLTTS